jgi:uncharacterized membrane protein
LIRLRRPIYARFAQFPVVCFTLTLLTDLAYWQTSNLLWQHFSEWLLFVGLVFGGLAILVAAVEFLLDAGLRAERPAWPRVVCFLIALVLAFVNSFVHSADGWTAVVPYGLVLSVLTVLLIVAADWLGRSTTFSDDVVVAAP